MAEKNSSNARALRFSLQGGTIGSLAGSRTQIRADGAATLKSATSKVGKSRKSQ